MPRIPADQNASGRVWKVGELAERTGLTVRTLHHYDAIGLLCPSGRSGSAHGSGHRLYTTADVARLQQILSLRQLGFALEQIREYLARTDYEPRQVLRLHLQRIRDQSAELAKLESRLMALVEALDRAEVVSAEEFLITMQEMSMVEQYYTPEQLESLKRRWEEADEATRARWQQGPQMWADLQAEVQAAMDSGTDPLDPRAQDLARRWFGLVNEFTGGDASIFRSLRKMYQTEDTIHGMNVAAMRPMQEYIGKAASAAGIGLPE